MGRVGLVLWHNLLKSDIDHTVVKAHLTHPSPAILVCHDSTWLKKTMALTILDSFNQKLPRAPEVMFAFTGSLSRLQVDRYFHDRSRCSAGFHQGGYFSF